MSQHFLFLCMSLEMLSWKNSVLFRNSIEMRILFINLSLNVYALMRSKKKKKRNTRLQYK